jgi:putative endonuclease
MKPKEVGALGEKIARDFLRKRGYKIIESNYRCPQGEIDIIARNKGSLVFIEVKTRTGTNLGIPEESVNAQKQAKLRQVALSYLQKHHDSSGDWRIDVVAIELDGTRPKRINLIKNAVGED